MVGSILSQASKDPKIFRYILDEASNRGYLNPPKKLSASLLKDDYSNFKKSDLLLDTTQTRF